MPDRRTILLVEDNPDDIDLTLRAFRKTPVAGDIVVARDGVEALDYLFGTGAHAGRDADALPAVMLLDLKLPLIDGLEVLRRVRADERTCLLTVVVLTSSAEDADVAGAYRLGANSYIRKPVDYDRFIEAVGRLGAYWLQLNEPPPGARP